MFQLLFGFIQYTSTMVDSNSQVPRTQNVSEPPPYDALRIAQNDETPRLADESQQHRIEVSTPESEFPQSPPAGIRASDTPQWRWNKEQCRIWLQLVLMEYCNKSRREAFLLSEEFEGFGPSLYIKSCEKWVQWLGLDGQSIHALLIEMRRQKGAVPEGILVGFKPARRGEFTSH